MVAFLLFLETFNILVTSWDLYALGFTTMALHHQEQKDMKELTNKFEGIILLDSTSQYVLFTKPHSL